MPPRKAVARQGRVTWNIGLLGAPTFSPNGGQHHKEQNWIGRLLLNLDHWAAAVLTGLVGAFVTEDVLPL